MNDEIDLGAIDTVRRYNPHERTALELRVRRALDTTPHYYSVQHPIGPWTADFKLIELSIVVEADGCAVHYCTECGYAALEPRLAWYEHGRMWNRDATLARHGLITVRIPEHAAPTDEAAITALNAALQPWLPPWEPDTLPRYRQRLYEARPQPETYVAMGGRW